MSLLKIDSLTKNFGGLAAVSNVSMELDHNELIGLIGPNGAGKTTFFNLVTGIYEPSSGTISLETDQGHQVINGMRPDKINQLGISRTFQNIRLFPNMTVLENVMVAMHQEDGNSILSSILRTSSYYDTEEKMRTNAIKLLEIFDLDSLAEEKANSLAYGQQRHLEIVRALATKPKILFLDEPAAGMNPNETAELTELIYKIKEKFKLTVVLIEHDMSLVMDICQRIYVLDYGRMIAQGSPSQIQSDPRVIEAYLGGGA